MKTIPITEILTAEQIAEVERILNGNHGHATTQMLKDYLCRFDKQLESKGFLYEYLAYFLIAKHQNIIP